MYFLTLKFNFYMLVYLEIPFQEVAHSLYSILYEEPSQPIQRITPLVFMSFWIYKLKPGPLDQQNFLIRHNP